MSTSRDSRLRREGAADAVLRIVAAKTLLKPLVTADEVGNVVGLSRAELQVALARWRGASTSVPPLHPIVVPSAELDALVLQALAACGEATPTAVRSQLASWGAEYSIAGIYDSLARLLAYGVLERPQRGVYTLRERRRAS